MSQRTPTQCKGDVYRCPALWNEGALNSNGDGALKVWSELRRSWMPYVKNTTRRFFLEKDPDLSVGFINGTNTSMSLNVVICF